MSAVGTRVIDWHGGRQEFCLAAVGSVLALEDACKAGIATIYQRLASGSWYLQDVRETIRLSLIGAGLSAKDAEAACIAHVDRHPGGLGPNVLTAMAILEAVIIGVPDDPVGKKRRRGQGRGRRSSTATAASADHPSSDSVPA